MEPLRRQIIHLLGAKCKECGFDRYEEALTIVSDKTVKEVGNHPRYIEYCWDHLERCHLLCQNCGKHRMAVNREEARRDVPWRKGWFVWACQAPKDLTLTFPWLDKKCAEGWEVAVYFRPDEEVWSYGPKGKYAPMARTWAEFARKTGGPSEAPEEGTLEWE